MARANRYRAIRTTEESFRTNPPIETSTTVWIHVKLCFLHIHSFCLFSPAEQFFFVFKVKNRLYSIISISVYHVQRIAMVMVDVFEKITNQSVNVTEIKHRIVCRKILYFQVFIKHSKIKSIRPFGRCHLIHKSIIVVTIVWVKQRPIYVFYQIIHIHNRPMSLLDHFKRSSQFSHFLLRIFSNFVFFVKDMLFSNSVFNISH